MRGRVHIWFIALFFAALVLPFPLFWLLRGILPNLLYTLAVSPLIYGAVLLAAKLLKRRE